VRFPGKGTILRPKKDQKRRIYVLLGDRPGGTGHRAKGEGKVNVIYRRITRSVLQRGGHEALSGGKGKVEEDTDVFNSWGGIPPQKFLRKSVLREGTNLLLKYRERRRGLNSYD